MPKYGIAACISMNGQKKRMFKLRFLFLKKMNVTFFVCFHSFAEVLDLVVGLDC